MGDKHELLAYLAALQTAIRVLWSVPALSDIKTIENRDFKKLQEYLCKLNIEVTKLLGENGSLEGVDLSKLLHQARDCLWMSWACAIDVYNLVEFWEAAPFMYPGMLSTGTDPEAPKKRDVTKKTLEPMFLILLWYVPTSHCHPGPSAVLTC